MSFNKGKILLRSPESMVVIITYPTSRSRLLLLVHNAVITHSLQEVLFFYPLIQPIDFLNQRPDRRPYLWSTLQSTNCTSDKAVVL